MKTIKIVSKSVAERAHVASLFQPVNGRTLERIRFDLGKYKPESAFIGREIQVDDDVVAVYAQTQRDSDGPYKALWCYCEVPKSNANANKVTSW